MVLCIEKILSIQEVTSMMNSERFASIYSHDIVYCPPMEEESALLEVALGCSWSKCLFCDFAKDPFHVHSMEKIERNLQILSEAKADKDRVFFLGENAFCLGAPVLLEIMQMTKRYMPQVTTFGMYARFDDVLRKSDEELKLLFEAGLTDLHMGFESGSDMILLTMNKGVSISDILEATRRMDRAGIRYHFTIILGLGGKQFSFSHATETARLLNRTKPRSIWCLNLKVWPDTPLEKMVKRGEFEPLSLVEMLQEEWLMLQNLNVKDCFYMDTTALNQFTIQGFLPDSKDAMLYGMRQLLEKAN